LSVEQQQSLLAIEHAQALPDAVEREVVQLQSAASGSLATLTSRTTRPVASTTQTLDCSSDTSIPT
jgi:hypothetical protein